ncbi:MAG: hypothetical protein Kow001_00610 [Acidobacteriota bacterium]
MIRTAPSDPDQVIYGSALRWAWTLVEAGVLYYDPDRDAGLNDLVFAEFLPVPSGLDPSLKNWLERSRPRGPALAEIELSRLQEGPCVGVVGNRYAPPYLWGGLFHPVTGAANGVVRGGVEVDSLFGVNCLGFINDGPDVRPRVRVLGTLADKAGRSLSLRDFRESWTPEPGRNRHRLPGSASSAQSAVRSAAPPGECRLIVVAGHSTEAGKTTCARALVRGLRARGFPVTVEKKTGTACCRDWLSCLLDRTLESPLDPAAPLRLSLDLERTGGSDFVDALGVASDVSMPARRFARESAAYTARKLNAGASAFHVVELADGISHTTNQALLVEPAFRRRIDALVYCPLPSPEATAHFLVHVARLGLSPGTPVLLSGPLANESCHRLARLEVEHRWRIPVVPSATLTDAGWEPMGDGLAAALLDALGRIPESFQTTGSPQPEPAS